MKLETAQKILQKTKQDYEELADIFHASRTWPWLEVKNLIEKYVKGGMKILDLGCGNGRLFELLKDKDIEYLGVDNCQRLIKIAKERFGVRGTKFKTNLESEINSKFKIQNSKFHFLIGDALNLPFGDNSFDMIFAIALLHHIPSKQLRLKVLKNCYQILKPGGFLVLTVWNLWQPGLLLRYKIWPMIFGWRPKNLDWQDVFIPWKLPQGKIMRYYHAFNFNELKKVIIEAGFQIEKLNYFRKGQLAKWYNGWNLLALAKK
jgi:SAM-dependent methyltransferase